MLLAQNGRLDAPADLRPFVSEIAFAHSHGKKRVDAFYAPRAETSLLVRFLSDGEAVVNVLGPLTRARRKSFVAPHLMIRVLLRAGRARELLGVPLHDVADQVVPIEDLWGDAGRRTRGELAGSNVARAMRILETTLRGRARSAEEPSARVKLLSRAMFELDNGVPRVATLATKLGISDRHLRRLFHEDLGMTPKHYGRMARLRRVLARDGSSASWSQVALETGFYDQSHLIRDFRELLQVTPGALGTAEAGGAHTPPPPSSTRDQ